MCWRHAVQLFPSRVALLSQARDEDLLQDDPFPLLNHLRPRPEIIEHFANRLHFWNRMIELGHRCAERVGVRVHQARQDHLAAQIDNGCPRPLQFQHLVICACRYDVVALDSKRLLNGESVIDCDDFAVVKNQVWSGGIRARSNKQEYGHQNALTGFHFTVSDSGIIEFLSILEAEKGFGYQRLPTVTNGDQR